MRLPATTCKTCNSLRAKFLLWLGEFLNIMEPAKEKKVEQKGFTQDQISAIVGSKELELIALRMQIAELSQRLAKYETPEGAKLEVVK